MQYRYVLIKEEWLDRDAHRVSYGAAVINANEDDFCVLESYSDLCMDELVITQLIELCNNLDLAPEHFSDVIEDFLGSI